MTAYVQSGSDRLQVQLQTLSQSHTDFSALVFSPLWLTVWAQKICILVMYHLDRTLERMCTRRVILLCWYCKIFSCRSAFSPQTWCTCEHRLWINRSCQPNSRKVQSDKPLQGQWTLYLSCMLWGLYVCSVSCGPEWLKSTIHWSLVLGFRVQLSAGQDG